MGELCKEIFMGKIVMLRDVIPFQCFVLSGNIYARMQSTLSGARIYAQIIAVRDKSGNYFYPKYDIYSRWCDGDTEVSQLKSGART